MPIKLSNTNENYYKKYLKIENTLFFFVKKLTTLMKRILFISFLLFSFLFSFSQDSYITLDGKTINGTVENYKEWSKNPTTVLFKNNVTDAEIILTPENCKSFTAGSDYFISYSGTRILNSDDILSQGLKSDQMVKDSVHVFLRRIYQFNNYTLYKLYDNKRINFYVSDHGNIKELEFYETINDNTVIPFNGYKNYLMQYFSSKGIKGLEGKINNLNYKENDLLNFFAFVFGDKLHSSENLRNKYASEILLGAGLNESFAKIESSYGAKPYTGTSFSPSVEFGIRIYSQRNFGKPFFQPTISLMPLSNSFDNGRLKSKATLINVNLGVGYMFVKKENFSFYAAVAGGLPVLLNYQTIEGAQSNVKSNGADDRLTVRPELGVLINQKINISFCDMLPINLPFISDLEFNYNVNIASLSFKYAFIQKHRNK